jgi:hypothetical protein
VGTLLLDEWPFMPPDLREISATAPSGNTKTDCEMIVRRADTFELHNRSPRGP